MGSLRLWAMIGLLFVLAGCAKARRTLIAEDSGNVGIDARFDRGNTFEWGSRLDLKVEARPGSDLLSWDSAATDLVPRDLKGKDSCSSECAGKCLGADDGCGKPCAANKCAGCCKGKVCKAGGATKECGAVGGVCKDCTYTHDCTAGICAAGACTKQNKPSGVSCAGGRCYGGLCCKGCWGGGSCRGGTSGQYCGKGGVVCSTCQALNPCKTASCSSGSCILSQRPFGWGCPNGKCLHGNCCSGCISNGACHPGNTNGNCGNWGGPCQSCWAPKSCNNGNCG